MVKTVASQVEFSSRAQGVLDIKDLNSMPLFEQGMYEMVSSIKLKENKLLELRKLFEKNIMEKMNKGVGKHLEFHNQVEGLTQQLHEVKELSKLLLKEFESLQEYHAILLDEKKKKKPDKDLFYEIFRFGSNVRNLFSLLQKACDSLIKIMPLAVQKENEILKLVAGSFKEFSLFAAEHLGPITTQSLLKSKYIFEVVESCVTKIDNKFSVEGDYRVGNILVPEEIKKLNTTKEMLNQDLKVRLCKPRTSNSACSTTSNRITQKIIS